MASKNKIYRLCGVVAAMLAGCGGDKREVVTVYVAASLTEVVEEVGEVFEREHGVRIVFNIAGSGTLARQIIAASRADVFLSAGTGWMDLVEEAGKLEPGTRRAVCSNALVVIGNAKSGWVIELLSELGELPFSFLCIGDPDYVPAGRYAKESLEAVRFGDDSSLWDRVSARVSPTPDVRAALMQVEGSLDAVGIVYRTDARARSEKVRILFEIQRGQAPSIQYTGGVVAGSEQAATARQFLDVLTGPRAAAVFARHGFVPVDYN